jgi:hypothetical protein
VSHQCKSGCYILARKTNPWHSRRPHSRIGQACVRHPRRSTATARKQPGSSKGRQRDENAYLQVRGSHKVSTVQSLAELQQLAGHAVADFTCSTTAEAEQSEALVWKVQRTREAAGGGGVMVPSMAHKRCMSEPLPPVLPAQHSAAQRTALPNN